MGCVQSYFKRAHTAGLSPSSTQDSNSKTAAAEDDVKPIIAEEKSLTEEPESNDTSYGVEATAVRTLAASTGTVAILGTTAKTNGKNDEEEDEKQVETIPEENENAEDNKTVSLEKAEVHEPNLKEQNNATVENNQSQLPLNENIAVIESETLDNKNEIRTEEEVVKSRENSVLSRASESSQNVTVVSKTETPGDSPISVDVEEKTNEEANAASEINQEPVKEIEEDNSKSISSERLKTNSISDTTLSESFNAELENNSVKQSPSVEKVLESFDSSSTVEFVDVVNKEASRSKRSIDEDLIDASVSSTPLRSTSVDVMNQSKENVATPTDAAPVKTELVSLLNNQDIIVDQEIPKNSDAVTPAVEEVLENKRSLVSSSASNLVDKTDEDVPQEDSSINFEEPRPVSAVVVSPITSVQAETNVNIERNVEDIRPAVPREIILTETETSETTKNVNDMDEKLVSAATTIQATFRGYQTRQNLKTEESEKGSEKELEKIGLLSNQELDDQLNSAAATIQATFRGYQERKNLKTEDQSENLADLLSKEEVPKDLDSAATIIQSTFRGFQTRKNLQYNEIEKEDNNIELPISNEEMKDEINEAATTIQAAFRGFKTRQDLKNEDPEIDTKAKESVKVQDEDFDKLNSAATTIQATFRGFQSRQTVQKENENEKEILQNENIKSVDQKENIGEEKNDLTTDESNEQLVSAATTIQATFRGYQSRKGLNNPESENNEIIEEPVADSQPDDGTLNSAATTIQANFRGFQTRKNLKNEIFDNKTEVEESEIGKDEEINTEEGSDQLSSAATTIQAAFRGFQTRQELKRDLEVEESLATLDEVIKAESADLSNDIISEDQEQSKPDENLANKQNALDDKLNSAASTIQATFRGFQTRKNLNKDEETPNVNEESNDVKTPVSLTPEIIDSVKEEVDEICKKAVETTESILAAKESFGADKVKETEKIIETADISEKLLNVVEAVSETESKLPNEVNEKEKKLPEVADKTVVDDNINKVDPTLAKEKERSESNEENKTDGSKQKLVQESDLVTNNEVNSTLNSLKNNNSSSLINTSEDINNTLDSFSNGVNVLTEGIKDDLSEDKLSSAATTIQASFRGFQARQTLQKMVDTEEQPDSMPDYPPPSLDDESLFGPSVADEDLPLPDFEALESSYSEDVPTEPLAPPPLDHDSLKFNEEDEFDEELQSLQKPQECDELPENRLTLESDTSTEVESSLSSAATKIQAGVRGFLTRRQFQNVQKGTDSTSATSIFDSDRSVGDLSGSHEEEGPVRSAISIDEESEVCKHRNSPEKEDLFENNILELKKKQGKRMSLGNSLHEAPPRQRKQRALSMQIHRDNISDEEVWSTLKNEMSSAATLIQSNYRGYRARKQLQREDAVQVLTSSSSQATPGPGSIDVKEVEPHPTRSSGEYHDIIALTPPNIQKDKPPEEPST